MKKLTNLFLIITLLIINCVDLASQWDARQFPYYLDTQYISKFPRFSPKKAIKISNEYPPEYFKDLPEPEKLLSSTGFEIIPMSSGPYDKSETWIAINPQNPNHIIGTANDSRYNFSSAGYKMGAYYTTDGGITWGHSTTPANKDLYISMPANGSMTNFDPCVVFDARGWAFYSFGVCQVPSGDIEGDNGVFVCRSKNGGRTWEEPFPVALEILGTTTQPFNDKFLMACDWFSPNYKNNLYVVWQRFRVNPGVCFSRSTDGGENWSPAIVISGGQTSSTQSPCPAVGPNGEVYVVWELRESATETKAMFQKSTNGGITWLANPMTIQTLRRSGTYNSTSGRRVLADKQNMRVSDFPAIAVDISNSPRRGWIYVVQSGKTNDDKSGIFLAVSTDGGKTWSSGKKIDDNQLGNDCFFPSISVDPMTGFVSVLYYSSQNDPANKGVDAYLAVSEDGQNFTNIRITPNTWYIRNSSDVSYQGPGNYYWGDYTSIASWNNNIYPCFWMPSVPNGNFSTVNVYTALISTNPMPPENLTVEFYQDNPLKITLHWDDPTKTLLGTELTDFKIVLIRNGEQVAEVDKGVQKFDDYLEDSKQYVYQIKTRDVSGRESTIKTISVIGGGALEPLPPTNVVAMPHSDGITVKWKNPSRHIDNSFLYDFKSVRVYSGENLIGEVEVPNIQAGEEATFNIQVPTKKFYNISLRAVTLRNNQETESQPTPTYLVYAGSPLQSLYETFDNSENMIAYYTDGWGVTDKKAVSLPYAITDSPVGDYKPNSANRIIFAPVIPSAEYPTLSFEHIALIDTTKINNLSDYGVVLVSDDYCQSWQTIASFDMRSSDKFTGNIETSEFVTVNRTLSQYIGKTVYVMFILYSNALRQADGWYVDNLRLDDNANSVDFDVIVRNEAYIEAYPNPVRDNLNISYLLPIPANVKIEVFDGLGNQILAIDKGYSDAGRFNEYIDLSNVATGVYYIRLNINGRVKTVPIIKISN